MITMKKWYTSWSCECCVFLVFVGITNCCFLHGVHKNVGEWKHDLSRIFCVVHGKDATESGVLF